MSLFADATRHGAKLYPTTDLPPVPNPPAARARTTDPSTSHEAAATVTKMPARQLEVLTIHRDNPGGLSDEQVIDQHIERFTYDHTVRPQTDSSIRTRRSELVAAGWLEDSGRRGRTKAGRSTIIWQLTARARR